MRRFAEVALCCVYFYAFSPLPCALGYEVRSLTTGRWIVKNENNSIQLNATVPGSIYADLSKAGRLPESVYYRLNDVKYRWIAQENWTYSSEFTVKEVNAKKKYELVFDGLDGLAKILLNNRSVGQAVNTFVRYRFDVTHVLRKNGNHLVIQFESPIVSGRKLAAKSSHPILPNCPPENYHGECHGNQLRRMPASFGWDWGLAVPSVGIWKRIELVAYEQDLRIRDVLVSISSSQDEQWKVRIEIDCETATDEDASLQAKWEAILTVDNGEVLVLAESANVDSRADGRSTNFSAILHVPKTKVKLWWPNGYGEQPLYNLTVTVATEHGSDKKTVSIGFREVKLIQEDVSGNGRHFGQTFYFAINGVPIFAKGSNYIPHNIFLEEAANNATITRLLSAAREANMNMMRIWGGGIYADDFFYMECDRLGIMVWQDMMFACSMYPTDPAFLINVRTEIGQQIGRLQHHPSIVVWAGNNENEAALRGNWYGTKSDFHAYQKEYVQLYVETIRKEVLARDDTRPFLVSSPTNGMQSEAEGYVASNPYDNLFGDVHFYEYLSNVWVIDYFPIPRFSSEYGLQSLPSLSSLREVATTEDLQSLNTEFFVNRQHMPLGYLFLVYQLLMQFSAPRLNDVNNLIYLTQVNQAWGVKAQTEWYRSWRTALMPDGRGRTMGAMYWQLNDIWQAPSWSSIEFGGKWKMLHYYAKKFFAPVIVAAHIRRNGRMAITLVSDLLYDLTDVEMKIMIFRWNSWTPAVAINKSVTVQNQAAVEVLSVYVERFLKDHSDCDAVTKCFIKVNLTNAKTGRLIHENFLFPSLMRQAEGIQPSNIQVEVKSCGKNVCNLELKVSAISLFVWLDANDIAGRFSDNGFTMTEPERTVQFYPEHATSADALRAALSVNVLDDKQLNKFAHSDKSSKDFIGRYFKNLADFTYFRLTGKL